MPQGHQLRPNLHERPQSLLQPVRPHPHAREDLREKGPRRRRTHLAFLRPGAKALPRQMPKSNVGQMIFFQHGPSCRHGPCNNHFFLANSSAFFLNRSTCRQYDAQNKMHHATKTLSPLVHPVTSFCTAVTHRAITIRIPPAKSARYRFASAKRVLHHVS